MISLQAEDRQRIAISWAWSFGITIAMLGLFFFIRLSSSMPKVEPMELFVEVNYGTSNVGKGDIQTFNKPNPSKVAENMKADADEVKKVKSVATPKPTPPTPPKIESPKPVKTVAEKPVITSKTESPVEAPEKTDVKKSTGSEASSTPVAKPAPEKAINKDALFSKSSGSKSGSNGTNGTQTGVGGNNNGDDADGVGDKGAKSGSLFAKTYKGEGGGGGTAVGLNLSGWSWSRRPVVDDNSDATGDITFKITVDRNGRVKSIVTQSTTVTDYAVVNKYKSAVRDLTFIPKSANVPDESVGTITFKIRSR
jgi:outer membrane biosynthesis protein TonB